MQVGFQRVEIPFDSQPQREGEQRVPTLEKVSLPWLANCSGFYPGWPRFNLPGP